MTNLIWELKGKWTFHNQPFFLESDVYFKTFWNPWILLKEIRSQTVSGVKELKEVFIGAYINSDATNDMYLFTVI